MPGVTSEQKSHLKAFSSSHFRYFAMRGSKADETPAATQSRHVSVKRNSLQTRELSPNDREMKPSDVVTRSNTASKSCLY